MSRLVSLPLPSAVVALLLLCLVCFSAHAVPIPIRHDNTLSEPFYGAKRQSAAPWQIGAGIYDITGPAAQTGMMGYAMANQSTAGIHYRLRARAFAISDGSQHLVFVSTDSCMIMTSLKREVVKALQAKYSGIYDYSNVMLSGTHTHSGPAGYSEYAMYDLTSWGFIKENWKTIIDGIVNAITIAHDNMVSSGKILINVGELLESNINRSPTAYENNPAEEKAKYKYNVDKNMTLLRFEDANGKELGMINWFSVHGTSMTNRNKLISGDNKGHASYLFEKLQNPSAHPGKNTFVAAFAQSNEGDVSPNTRGAFCDNGMPCESVHSTCGGWSQGCHGYGPGKNDFESCKIIGANQFKKAKELYDSAKEELQGPLQHIHMFVDMSQVVVSPKWTGLSSDVKTCMAALGDSFAGGTTDGPGDFNFHQGTNDTSTNPYWNFIAHFLSEPTEEQTKCQYPKPILLNTGGINFPSPWTPTILPLQLFRVGKLVIIGVPGEFTTMAGRRLRDTVKEVMAQNGVPDVIPVIAGLTNAYSHYITTHEEYVVQRYEGASTLYGPWTLAAYQQLFASMADAMAKGQKMPPGPTPPDLSGQTFNFNPPVVEDVAPIFGHFGQVDVDAKPSYAVNTTVKVSFWGANPRNDYRIQDTFLTVEQKQTDGTWKVLLTDSDWDTRFYWEAVMILQSRITITWDIDPSTQPGTYRIQTFGKSKSLFGTYTPYTGTSREFQVTAA